MKMRNNIHALDHDILSNIFAFLDLLDVIRCSVVSKSWNTIINRSMILQVLYCKHWGSTWNSNPSTYVETSFKKYVDEMAMKQHKLSLEEGHIDVFQLAAHPVRVAKCQAKLGLVLTGVGDKVMRLWSLDSCKCLKEYSLSNMGPLVDFDFDESKIVSLNGTKLCIWRRSGKKSVFPSIEGSFTKGLCMRYLDPEAVVGCEDGLARIYDMYTRKCSRIIRMHAGPITCLSLGEDQLILGGSSHGRITISGLSSNQHITTLQSTDSAGIQTLCYNHSSHLVFCGSTAGYASSWDLRTRRKVWERRASPNVIYSMQRYGENDTLTLVAGGIDGILRVLDQNTGDILSSIILDDRRCSANSGMLERRRGRRISNAAPIDSISTSARPPITCLAVGMRKIITTHYSKHIRIWKFSNHH